MFLCSLTRITHTHLLEGEGGGLKVKSLKSVAFKGMCVGVAAEGATLGRTWQK